MRSVFPSATVKAVSMLKKQHSVRELRTTWKRNIWTLSCKNLGIMVKLCKPSLVWSAYTFQWIQWGPSNESGKGLLEKMTNSQTNIAVLSALLISIWFEMVTDFEDHREDSTEEIIVFFCAMGAISFHFLSMINSTILAMLINELDSDQDTLRFTRKIGINTVTPMIQFYIGCIFGVMSYIVYTYAYYTFPVFIAVTGFLVLAGFLVNALYYQFNVKSLGDTLATTPPPVCLKADQIEKYWDQYIDVRGHENVDSEDFQGFILETHWKKNEANVPLDFQTYKLGFVTVRRIEKLVEGRVNVYLENE